MAKKKINYLSYLPVITLAIGLIVSWAKFSVQAENTKTKVDRLETKVEERDEETDKEIDELKDDNNKLDKSLEVNKIQQENIKKEVEETNKKVEETNDKIDKVIDLLMQMRKK